MTAETAATPPDLGVRGGVASSQPLATKAGMEVLKDGGTAVDAAITAMALIAVLEPMSCGLGGDAWAMIWDPGEGPVGINGSGPTSSSVHLNELAGDTDQIVADLVDRPGLSVTVPGALRTWEEMLARYGRLDLPEALEPARQLSREGFAVGDVTAWMWSKAQDRLAISAAGNDLLPGGRAPVAGEIVHLPQLADSLDAIAAHGPSYLYDGPIGHAIVETVRSMQGVLDQSDLVEFEPEWVPAIAGRYRRMTLHQCPPNSQAVAALVAMSRLESSPTFDDPLDPARVATLLEHMGAGLDAADFLVGDPRHGAIEGQSIVGATAEWAQTTRRFPGVGNGDTAAVVTVDSAGMACSLLSSLYANFGSGIVVPGTGIALHNRASRMSLNRSKVNSIDAHRRPRHTLMPALFTIDGRFRGAIGVVGGHRQPQAQVQVLSALEDYGMNPQNAVDQFRVGIDPENMTVAIEEGMPEDLEEYLARLGHITRWIGGYERVFFGGVQLLRVTENGAIEGASDPRKDGSVAIW